MATHGSRAYGSYRDDDSFVIELLKGFSEILSDLGPCIMDALHDAKYKVPGDMSVMGCDNTLFAKVKEVSLTTIEHFVIYKGMDACDIIIKKIYHRQKWRR